MPTHFDCEDLRTLEDQGRPELNMCELIQVEVHGRKTRMRTKFPANSKLQNAQLVELQPMKMQASTRHGKLSLVSCAI